MSVGLFFGLIGVVLLWSGLRNKDPQEAALLLIRNQDPMKAKPISQPRPDTFVAERRGGSGDFSDATPRQNLGGNTFWTKTVVATYTLSLARAFGVTAGGQCRKDGVVPPFGSQDSLHFERNGCRARDFTGPHDRLVKFEQWAKAQGDAFAEVLYTGVPGHGPGMGGVRHLHLGFPKSGPVPKVPKR